jgi:hypothetical protein
VRACGERGQPATVERAAGFDLPVSELVHGSARLRVFRSARWRAASAAGTYGSRVPCRARHHLPIPGANAAVPDLLAASDQVCRASRFDEGWAIKPSNPGRLYWASAIADETADLLSTLSIGARYDALVEQDEAVPA